MSRLMLMLIAGAMLLPLHAARAEDGAPRLTYDDLAYIYIHENPTLLDNPKFLSRFALMFDCEAYKAVRGNEFKQGAYLAALKKKLRAHLDGMNRNQVYDVTLPNTQVGKYDFEKQRFEYAPLGSDVNIAYQPSNMRLFCSQSMDRDLLPSIFNLRLTNADGIKSLPMEPDVAEKAFGDQRPGSRHARLQMSVVIDTTRAMSDKEHAKAPTSPSTGYAAYGWDTGHILRARVLSEKDGSELAAFSQSDLNAASSGQKQAAADHLADNLKKSAALGDEVAALPRFDEAALYAYAGTFSPGQVSGADPTRTWVLPYDSNVRGNLGDGLKFPKMITPKPLTYSLRAIKGSQLVGANVLLSNLNDFYRLSLSDHPELSGLKKVGLKDILLVVHPKGGEISNKTVFTSLWIEKAVFVFFDQSSPDKKIYIEKAATQKYGNYVSHVYKR